MKILLDYDAVTGNVTNPEGTLIASWLGLEHLEHKTEDDDKPNFEGVLALVNAGLKSEEIIDLKRKGLL